MVSDDVIYCFFMVVSVIVGPVFRTVLKGEFLKRWISTAIGFSLLWLVCGEHVIHTLINVAGNVALFHLLPHSDKTLPSKSFIWNFGYLVLFRTVHWFGIPAPSPVTNAAQLFLTLRMVGLAFEVNDYFVRQKSIKNPSPSEDLDDLKLQDEYCSVSVTNLDIISYAYCYIGLLTGPYYRYRTYQDWLRMPNDTKINVTEPFINRVKQLPVIAVCYLFFSYFFNIQYVETDVFLEHSFLYRLLYMVPMFTIFRTRLYLAWIMSELMSISAGLGAYPVESEPKCGQGPTDYKKLDAAYAKSEMQKDNCAFNFETIHNIDIYGCELAPMTKQGLRSWNMSVQFWLANYVHRRVPQAFKAYRVSITMAVSAFWHGIHPGYYLTFLLVPFILMAEDAMIKGFRDGASPEMQQLFDWGCWFFKMRGFDYNCMGFLLLGLGSTLRYWYSIYFLGHIVTLFFFVLGRTAIAMRPKKDKTKKEN